MDNKTTTQTTIEEIKQENALLKQQVAELTAKLQWFEEQFRLSRQQRFGRSSEQTNSEQLRLFNEADIGVRLNPINSIKNQIKHQIKHLIPGNGTAKCNINK